MKFYPFYISEMILFSNASLCLPCAVMCPQFTLFSTQIIRRRVAQSWYKCTDTQDVPFHPSELLVIP